MLLLLLLLLPPPLVGSSCFVLNFFHSHIHTHLYGEMKSKRWFGWNGATDKMLLNYITYVRACIRMVSRFLIKRDYKQRYHICLTFALLSPFPIRKKNKHWIMPFDSILFSSAAAAAPTALTRYHMFLFCSHYIFSKWANKNRISFSALVDFPEMLSV